jgi:signal transduction histidine kinase
MDEGIGISNEEKPRIFDKFYRIGNEDTRKTKGTGLGLYIVKNIVKLHQGNTSVSNNSPRGSIFEIIFPKK